MIATYLILSSAMISHGNVIFTTMAARIKVVRNTNSPLERLLYVPYVSLQTNITTPALLSVNNNIGVYFFKGSFRLVSSNLTCHIAQYYICFVLFFRLDPGNGRLRQVVCVNSSILPLLT